MNKRKIIVGSMLGLVAMSGAFLVGTLKASADTGTRSQQHVGVSQEKRAGRAQERVAIRTAMESGDYSAWKDAMGNRPNASQITEAEFVKLQEAHKLAQEGKFDEAQKIRESLGMNFQHKGQGQGRHNQ